MLFLAPVIHGLELKRFGKQRQTRGIERMNAELEVCIFGNVSYEKYCASDYCAKDHLFEKACIRLMTSNFPTLGL